ncbi:MAG: carbohydrate kinase [Verrucomicrobiae bacterium]|nr:carbohydrate kinase [Verrucomicrobiae bacterium]
MAPSVVCLGEVLWDLLPAGPQLGGAPANVAVHARSLGARAALVSRVGDDAPGRQAVAALAARGVDTAAVSTDPDLPTGTVGVELDATGKPRFIIHEPAAWDHLTAGSGARHLMATADAVCFGTLAQRNTRSREAIHGLLAASAASRLVLCDINLRPPFVDRTVVEMSLQAADILKLSGDELPMLAALLGLEGGVESQVVALARRFDLETVLVTLGAGGCRAWADGHWTTEPGRSVTVLDTIGAGDAFTAAYLVGRLAGRPLDAVLRHATDIAAFVCTQAGATPELPEALTAPFRSPNAQRV